ncbi:hypothetical protein LSTR_LSTR004256 [Laodelphax striatellus]|uniref:Uncharacterized protein n=1 Tax=Laodelphax striatellus TaxID=195883 RepID=A0A482XAV1_LAOST|nr:hypothetical protein LSTR_LSTR004256 [Laodelphax striatellus]
MRKGISPCVELVAASLPGGEVGRGEMGPWGGDGRGEARYHMYSREKFTPIPTSSTILQATIFLWRKNSTAAVVTENQWRSRKKINCAVAQKSTCGSHTENINAAVVQKINCHSRTENQLPQSYRKSTATVNRNKLPAVQKINCRSRTENQLPQSYRKSNCPVVQKINCSSLQKINCRTSYRKSTVAVVQKIKLPAVVQKINCCSRTKNQLLQRTENQLLQSYRKSTATVVQKIKTAAVATENQLCRQVVQKIDQLCT